MISQQRRWNSQHHVHEDNKDPATAEKPEPTPLSGRVCAAERWIGEHPALCLGIALIAGVSLGWLVKRK